MIAGKEEQDIIGIIVSRYIEDSFMRITYGVIGRRFRLVKQLVGLREMGEMS